MNECGKHIDQNQAYHLLKWTLYKRNLLHFETCIPCKNYRKEKIQQFLLYFSWCEELLGPLFNLGSYVNILWIQLYFQEILPFLSNKRIYHSAWQARSVQHESELLTRIKCSFKAVEADKNASKQVCVCRGRELWVIDNTDNKNNPVNC